MKKTLKSLFETGVLHLVVLCLIFALALVVSGCATQKKMRDIELKGMYVNGYSEVLAIGSGRLTSIPGEREALAAHYEEDTAWLQPNIKTHKLDIFMVGSNSTQNASQILGDICKAFAEVAPGVSKENAEVAKSVSTATPLGVVKSGGEVRKTVQLAKVAAKEVKGKVGSDSATDAAKSSTGNNAASDPHAAECTDGSCTTGACTDGNCSYNGEVK